jgi:hypothetical protein
MWAFALCADDPQPAGFGLSRDECGAIIMKARARVGWIDEK